MINKLLTISFSLAIFFTTFSCYKSTKKATEKKNVSHREKISQQGKETNSDDALSLKIGNYLKTNYLSEADLRVISTDQRRFQFSTTDLNFDGIDEIFVYLNSSYFCGSGGCTFLLLDKSLTLITQFTVTGTPILVSNEIENGWKKLYLVSNGYREMIYNTQNKSYPTNPSVEKKITEDVNNQEGIVRLFDSENQANNYY